MSPERESILGERERERENDFWERMSTGRDWVLRKNESWGEWVLRKNQLWKRMSTEKESILRENESWERTNPDRENVIWERMSPEKEQILRERMGPERGCKAIFRGFHGWDFLSWVLCFNRLQSILREREIMIPEQEWILRKNERESILRERERENESWGEWFLRKDESWKRINIERERILRRMIPEK